MRRFLRWLMPFGGWEQFPYWWRNKLDGLLGFTRSVILPGSVCGAAHGRSRCDKRRGHRHVLHADRRFMGRMPRGRAA